MSLIDLTFAFQHIDEFLEKIFSLQKDQSLNQKESDFISLLNSLRVSSDKYVSGIIKDIITEACQQYWYYTTANTMNNDKLLPERDFIDNFYNWLDGYLPSC